MALSENDIKILVEMSNEFDVLFNNIMSNAAPSVNEYEKSVFLTKGQDEVLKNYFNPEGNKYKEGFDGSQKRQVDFSMLIRTLKTATLNTAGAFDTRSKVVDFPTDAMFIINEIVSAATNEAGKYVALSVTPLSYSEYSRLMAKPYKYPPKNICWRLLNVDDTTTSRKAELITSYPYLKDYTVRYVKQPSPIILVDLDDNYSDVSLGGISTQTAYSLDPILIHEIVQRAVELAKAAYAGDTQSMVTMGERSE